MDAYFPFRIFRIIHNNTDLPLFAAFFCTGTDTGKYKQQNGADQHSKQSLSLFHRLNTFLQTGSRIAAGSQMIRSNFLQFLAFISTSFRSLNKFMEVLL